MERKTSQIIHAHDRFFRTVMANRRVAIDFLQAHLPDEIGEKINFNSLVLQPRSYIDDVRQETTVDILYKTTFGENTGFIYLLLEHQSTPDKLMPFRILKYICNIIDQHIKQTRSDQLPFIYPMVVYHAERPYPFSTDIKNLIDGPKELVDQYFLKPFQLIDLGLIEDKELKQHAWSGVMEIALKHIFARDILPTVKDISKLLHRLDQTGGRDYISIVLQYILSRGEFRDKSAFFELIHNEISTEVGEKIMTLGEQLIQEGVQKGIQKGKLEVAKRMISEGIEPSFVAKITELPLETLIA